MPRASHEITPADLMSMDDYAVVREERRRVLDAMKALRRVEVGPFATFHFESYDTMWQQVHEMLFVERGGAAQVAGELEAYNPLVPQGREFVATLMIGIGDAARRDRELERLGGIEDTVSLKIGDQTVRAVAESEVERTKASGRTSSVHFLHFPLTEPQAAGARDDSVPMLLEIGHANYPHITSIGAAARTEICQDLD